MRILIIEPLLKDQRGHHYFYTSALRHELDHRGLSYLIFGSKDADEACLDLPNFYPSLTEIISSFFQTKVLVLQVFLLPGLIKKFKIHFQNSLFDNPCISLQSKDVIFYHTPYIFELFAASSVFRKKYKVILDNKVKIVIGLNFRYVRTSRFLTFVLSCIYRFAINRLARSIGSQLVLCSDGELLREEYAHLLNKKVYRVPMPIFPLPNISPERPQSDAIEKTNTTVSFLGGARYNKGFDIFVDMVGMLKDDLVSKTLTILVHYDLHEQQQSVSDTRKVRTSREKLKLFQDIMPEIEVVSGTQKLSEYYRLLRRSDIVIIPYRVEGYRTVPSNIFWETVLAGKVPVVSNGTSMADELRAMGLDGLVVSTNDGKGFLDVVKKISSSYTVYQERIIAMGKRMQNFYSAASLVDALIGFSVLDS